MIKKVVIIDDDEALLESVTMILEEFGYEVKSYTNGHSLNEINQANTDVILLDYQLSDTDGGEIARILRAQPQTKDIPIVMLSAYHNMPVIYKKIGANDYISKPFDINYLVEKVDYFASKKHYSRFE